MEIFKGLGTAIVTPFDSEGKVDYDAFRRHIEFQIAGNVDAIIVCGTTGEAATLTYDERAYNVEFVMDVVAGRVPVIAGGGSNSTETTIRLCQDAAKAKPQGLLCVTPYYNKTTQKGLIAHYAKVAASVDLPIIIYNVPSRTGLNIEPETAFEIGKIPNIVGIKEAAGDIGQTGKLCHLCAELDNFDVYAGNDNEILSVLSLGGVGVISVMGNVAPKDIHDICFDYLEGRTKLAMEKQLKAIPLVEAIFCELNPLPVKHILSMMGIMTNNVRLPLTPELKPQSIELIKQAVKDYGLEIKG